MKILLVDDDAFLRDMYAMKFSEKGHTIDSAETAENALTKIRENEYDLVMLDVVMPGMSGIELLKHIKEEKNGKKIKCIMLSNQSEEQDKESAFAAGAIGYIVKAELIPSEVVDEAAKLISK